MDHINFVIRNSPLDFRNLQFQPVLSCTVHIQPAGNHGFPPPPSVSQATPITNHKHSQPLLPGYFKPVCGNSVKWLTECAVLD